MPKFKVTLAESTIHKVTLVATDEHDARRRAHSADERAWEPEEIAPIVAVIDSVQFHEESETDLFGMAGVPEPERVNLFDEPDMIIVPVEMPAREDSN